MPATAGNAFAPRGASAGVGTAAAAALALAACGDPTVDPAPPAERTLALDLPAAEREGILGWSWDEAPEVPGAPLVGAFDHGAAGKGPATLLYAPLDGARGDAAGAGSVTEGRFGDALALAAGSPGLRLTLEGPPLAPPWTVQVWFRPAGTKAGRVLDLVGAATVDVLSDGRLVAQLRGAQGGPIGGARIETRVRLLPDRWNHVAIAVEREDMPQLRLVVDGAIHVVEYGGERGDAPAAHVPPSWNELVVGAGLAGAADDLVVDAHAASIAELSERWTDGPAPGEHRLDLRYEDGTRTRTVWAGVVDRPFVDDAKGAAPWGAGRLVHLAAEDGRLVRAAGHFERDRPPLRPPPRTTHPTVYVGDHRLWTFSGALRDSHYFPMINRPDTWLYHSDRRRWELVETEIAPPGRCHQPAAWSPEHDLVLLAGGFRNEYEGREVFSDTWVYHVEERRWEERDPSGRQIPGHSDAGVVWHPGLERFVLVSSSRVWLYDPVADAWERLPPAPVRGPDGEPVEWISGGSPMIGVDPATGRVLLFGGSLRVDGEFHFQDSTAWWIPEENAFEVLPDGPAASPRVRAAFAWDAGLERFVLFGGVQDQWSARERDLWSFDPRTETWTEHRFAGDIGHRGGFMGMGYDPELGVHLVLCGRATVERFLNEAWRLRLDPDAAGRGTWVFDREAPANAAATEAFAVLDLPDGASATLRVAGSDDLERWTDWVEGETPPLPPGRYAKVEVTLEGGDEADPPAVERVGVR